MTQVRKISLVYDPAEDRLAWDAEDLQGGGARVWLTQRFCRDFVRALIARLPSPGVQALGPERQAMLQSFEQAAALSSFGKTPGVRLTPESTAGLVRAAHVTPTGTGLRLAFDFGAGEQRSIDLSAAGVRQMLSVMYDLHRAASWPTDYFPAWIARPAAPEDATALN
jgi:hypothetical protein